MTNRPKTASELQAMRQAGRMLATVLDMVVQQTVVGITAWELAQIAAKELQSLGGEPAFLGVSAPNGGAPFPSVICISINEQVQHGVPAQRVINEGDIVNFDFGVRYQNMITDAGLTIPVGKVSSQVQHLLDSTKGALRAGLAQVRAGANVRDISTAIEKVLLKAKLGIVYELVGHGVGHSLHEDPEIPNYRSGAPDYVLSANQTIAIEPIATLGSSAIQLADDNWTLVTMDGSWAAHFEHTICVTETGYEILTSL